MADRYVGTYAWDAVDLDAADLFKPGEVLESHGDEIDLILAADKLLAQALYDLGAAPPERRIFIAYDQQLRHRCLFVWALAAVGILCATRRSQI